MSNGIKKMHMNVELADGTAHFITAGNPSMVAYDRTRAKRGWPKSSEAPFLWSTFLAWHHLRYALGLYEGTCDEFMDRDCLAVEMTDHLGSPLDDEDDEDAVPDEDPTSRAAEPV